MTNDVKVPTWFWIAAIVLVLWELMGCFACYTQIRLGAAAMGPVDDWSLKYYAALPVWYNWAIWSRRSAACLAELRCCSGTAAPCRCSGSRSRQSW